MISVIVLTYNGEKFVYDQLFSILHQNLSPDEVIVIDDVSTDNTVSIIQDLISEHNLSSWKLIVNDVNLGPSRNAEKGLRLVQGDLILFSDQDDIWHHDKIKIMSKIMKERNEIKLLGSTEILIDNQKNHIKNKKINKMFKNKVIKIKGLKEFTMDDYLGYCKFSWHESCVRKEVIDFILHVGIPDLSISLGLDWFIGIISTIRGKSFRIGFPLVWRRIHSSNLSLGKLRKTTLLTTTREKRIEILRQTLFGHEYLLLNPTIKTCMKHDQIIKMQRIVNFLKKRLYFTKSRNIFIWISLLCDFKNYYVINQSIKQGIQMWLTDFLYAFNINWKSINQSFKVK